MKSRLKSGSSTVLFIFVLTAFLLLGAARAWCAGVEARTDEDNALLKKLLVTGCVFGLVAVVVLVFTQLRGSAKGRRAPKAPAAGRKARPGKDVAFRCRKCGRVFREELTEACKIECPLCGHVWQWPPPIELKLLKDRMTAFALDPTNPRGDLSLATKVLSRFSKGFAEKLLVAGRFLEGAEMLCVCERCGEIHIAQKKSRGLLGGCVTCKAIFLIW
jgi:hypothetical protein